MLLYACEVVERDEEAFTRQPIFATLAGAARNLRQCNFTRRRRSVRKRNRQRIAGNGRRLKR
jgi:hypothetical protein